MLNEKWQEKRFSLPVLIILLVVLWAVRLFTPAEGTLTWDVFGYYLCLPAKFVHDDIWLDNISWVHQAMQQYEMPGTLYQAYVGPNGTWMYWFLFGMGIMYFPFFLIGHAWALMGGYPADGFSMPYQYAIAYGSVVYASIGVVFLWKILRKFFHDKIVAIVLAVIVLGTNYLYFTSIGGSATANYLFTLVAALTWYTIRWHEKQGFFPAVMIGILSGLIILIKPSEVFCVLIPLLWPVEGGLRAKWRLIGRHYKHLIALFLAGMIVIFPQLWYWKNEAGAWIYDSYNNPGIGLDLFSPHILDVLFSFRKGWLIYTPLVMAGLLGFISLWRRRRDLFWPLFVYFIISFYIISSWTEWWYGGGYSCRPGIVLYVPLALATGFFFDKLLTKKWLSWTGGIIVSLLILLNLFQTWQYQHYILHSDRMTREYYFSVFGRTSLKPEDASLLLVERSVLYLDEFKHPELYQARNIGLYDFEDVMYFGYEKWYSRDTAHTPYYSLRMNEELEFSPALRTTYGGITYKDHAWLKASAWFYFPDTVKTEAPLLVVTTMHKGGNYKYRTYDVPDKTPGQWHKIEYFYQTPVVRSPEDEIVIYVWNRSKMTFYLDDLRVDAYTLVD